MVPSVAILAQAPLLHTPLFGPSTAATFLFCMQCCWARSLWKTSLMWTLRWRCAWEGIPWSHGVLGWCTWACTTRRSCSTPRPRAAKCRWVELALNSWKEMSLTQPMARCMMNSCWATPRSPWRNRQSDKHPPSTTSWYTIARVTWARYVEGCQAWGARLYPEVSTAGWRVQDCFYDMTVLILKQNLWQEKFIAQRVRPLHSSDQTRMVSDLWAGAKWNLWWEKKEEKKRSRL